MDVNALNYCRFSLMKLSLNDMAEDKQQGLLALPNLVDSSVVCILSKLKHLAQQ